MLPAAFGALPTFGDTVLVSTSAYITLLRRAHSSRLKSISVNVGRTRPLGLIGLAGYARSRFANEAFHYTGLRL